MSARVDACGPMRVHDLPNFDVPAGRILPGTIAGAVVITVADPGGRPSRRMRADIRACAPVAIHDLPDVDVGRCGIVPGDVACPIVIEVADAGRRPPER